MRWILAKMGRWRQRFARAAADDRMDEEIRFHLAMETEKNLRSGMSREEAEHQARIAFGGVEKHRTAMREGRRVPLLEDLAQDARYAARSLRRTPGFTAAVVLALAVGIGGMSAMYGVMSRLLLLPPPHVAAPERVVKLFFHYSLAGDPPRVFNAKDYPFYEALRDDATTLAAVGAYTSIDVPVGAGADAMQARATVASAGFWSAVGTRPALGRLFTDEEARPEGGTRVAVLGHAFWQRRYGGDPGVVGKTVEIKGHSYEIIGVTPRGFRGVELADVDLWLPISAYAEGTRDSLTWTSRWNGNLLAYVARLRPGVSVAQAEADLSRIQRNVDAAAPQLSRMLAGVKSHVSAGPVVGALGRDMQRIPEARVAVWLVGIAVVLLGVACATVASLLLLRAMRRRREIAVRLALGMSRGRMAIQLFTESLFLAVLGGVVAVAVSYWGGAWINRVLLPDLAWEPAALDRSMLAVTAACVLGTAFVAGLAPLLQTRFEPAMALRDGAQHGSSHRSRLHGWLLVMQIGLSVVLLTGAGLFLRSLHRIGGLDLGLDRDDVLVATVDFAGTGRKPAEVGAFYERALERVRALPGVDRASLALTTPLRAARAGNVELPPGTDAIQKEQGSPSVNYVTPDFFATTGTNILQGRGFLPQDRDGAPVMVMNETMARLGWPGGSPLGECVPFRRREEGCATVVGVVENARRFNLREPESLLYYRPLSRKELDDERVLLIRLAPGASFGAATLRRALTAIDPALPYVHVETLGSALDPEIRPWRLGANVFTAFGVLAMLLAAIGLYSALAYAVTQRTREIGIRLAIGASAHEVVRLVVRDGLRIALNGILIGMVVCLLGGRWIDALLFESSPRDWLVLLPVGVSILLVTLLAGLIPTRRAMRVDPMVAMRVE